jgi:outer membrane protein assembly factor BamD
LRHFFMSKPIMTKNFLYLILACLVLGAMSCKTEYEKLRVSPDKLLRLKKANEFYEKGEYLKAQGLLELAINDYRGQREAEDIYYKFAYTYYNTDQYVSAAHYFKNFSEIYGNSRYREEADFMAAYSFYKLSPTFRLEQSNSNKAIDALQTFSNTYPQSRRVEECNKLIDGLREKLEQKAYSEGQLYFDVKQYQAATKVFENLLKDFPESKDAEKVRYMIVRASYLLASNSVVDKQEERFANTLTSCKEFSERHKKSAFSREITSILKDCNLKIKQLKNGRYKSEGTGS